MSSVNVFYLIEPAPWMANYASADTFANDDPLGGPESTAVDPAVPKCHKRGAATLFEHPRH